MAVLIICATRLVGGTAYKWHLVPLTGTWFLQWLRSCEGAPSNRRWGLLPCSSAAQWLSTHRQCWKYKQELQLTAFVPVSELRHVAELTSVEQRVRSSRTSSTSRNERQVKAMSVPIWDCPINQYTLLEIVPTLSIFPWEVSSILKYYTVEGGKSVFLFTSEVSRWSNILHLVDSDS